MIYNKKKTLSGHTYNVRTQVGFGQTLANFGRPVIFNDRLLFVAWPDQG